MYKRQVLIVNREGENLAAGEYSLVISTDKGDMNILFTVLEELKITATTPDIDVYKRQRRLRYDCYPA